MFWDVKTASCCSRKAFRQRVIKKERDLKENYKIYFLRSSRWLSFHHVEIERPRSHELPDHFVRDLRAFGLNVEDHRRQVIDQLLLQKAGQQLSAGVILPDLLQLFVVREEEGQVLVGDVDVAVAAVLSMLLHGRAAAGVSVLVDLVLDLKISEYKQIVQTQ